MEKNIVFITFCMFMVKANAMENPKALIQAAEYLNVKQVRELLQHKSINLEQKDHNGHTALFKAVKVSFFDSRYPTEEEKEKQVTLIKLLLEAKASPDVLDNKNRSLYSFAAMANWEHTLQALGMKTKKEALEKSNELVLEKSNTLTIEDK